ncbi:MAG TPA: helix-turn-helix domain-containing protein [Polyangiaceae bacterium]|nr:helix-turn-helix domain-containing protein [Polyangiaceae bacterium]
MARPSKELPSPSTLVPAVVRFAVARGVDVEAWRWRFGLPADVAERQELMVSAELPEQILEALEQATGADAVVRMAAHLDARANRLVEIAVRSSATVRDALGNLARWAPLVHRAFEATMQGDRWVLRTPRRPRGLGRHVHELAVAHALFQVRASVASLAIDEAWFVHARPAHVDALHGLFGSAHVTFGCEDSGFSVASEDLDRPMPAADARTLGTIEPLLVDALGASPASPSFSDRIATHIASSLPGGSDVAEVARAMHMSGRTLQRRLEQEGTTFSEVLDRARLDVARRALAAPATTLSDVAIQLGFSDLATFTRAFKRWTGMPPGQWRRS